MTKKNYKAVRLEESTWAQLKEYSAACKLSHGTAIQRLIDHGKLCAAPPLDYFTLLSQLRHIGTNLNQLAARANSIHEISPIDRDSYFQNAAALKELMDYIREVVEGTS